GATRPPKPVIYEAFRLKPSAFLALACIGMNCLYWMIGRNERTVPPKPANSAPNVIWWPWWGEIPLSRVLKEKFGKILLVIIPLTAFGPEIPRNAMKSNRVFEAVLKGSSVERSRE